MTYVVRNFLSNNELKEIKSELLTNISNKNITIGDSLFDNCVVTSALTSFDNILLQKTSDICKIYGDVLYPCFSYTRVINKGSILNKHKDKHFANIVCSICIECEVPWGLWITDSEILLNQGDMVLFDARESYHWRNQLDSNYCIQSMLYYTEDKIKQELFKQGKIGLIQ